MVHQQIAHALRHDARILRGTLGRLALRQYHERAALPAPDQIAATPVGGADDARHAADAGIARGAIELLVVGTEVVDVEERQPDLVRVALREQPVPLQQLLEIGARIRARQAILAQPGRQARRRALRRLEPLAGIAVEADEMRELAGSARARAG